MQYSTGSEFLSLFSGDETHGSLHSWRFGHEVLVGMASPSLEIVFAAPALASAFGTPHDSLLGVHLGDAIRGPRARQRLELVTKHVSPELALPWAGTDGMAELVIRPALSGGRIWLMLHARRASIEEAVSPGTEVLGRRAELDAFESFLADGDAHVLCVQGPLGIGKTALLLGFAAVCDELGCRCFRIDARPPESRDELLAIVRAVRPDELFFTRHVVLIDAAESWGADEIPTILRQPPSGWRFVLASRTGDEHRSWSTIAGVRALSLGPLDRDAGAALAERWGATSREARALARRTAGHPGSIVELASATSPRTGSKRVDAAPLEAELAMPAGTLEAAAVPARITEEALTALLGEARVAGEAFRALRALCVPCPEGAGLRMPVVVRDALLAGLRQRSPERLEQLHARLVDHYCALIERIGFPHEAERIADDFFDSFSGDHPVARLAGDAASDPVQVRVATPADAARVFELARTLGRPDQAKDVAQRFSRRGVHTVIAERDGNIVGVWQTTRISAENVNAHAAVGEDAPLAAAVDAAQRYGLLGSGNCVTAILAFISEDTHAHLWGSISQAWWRAGMRATIAAPRLGAMMFVGRRDELGEFPPSRLGTLTFVTNGFDVLVCTLYRRGRRGMLEAMASHSPYVTPVATISACVIRDALRALADPNRLLKSPLLALNAVRLAAGGTGAVFDRAAVLAALLRDAVRDFEPDTDFDALARRLDADRIENASLELAAMLNRVTEFLIETETRAECIDIEALDRDEIADDLSVAAIPARVTEDVLAALLGDAPRAQVAYRAAASLGRTDSDGALRLTPELRRALLFRLRSRQPARYMTMRRRVAAHYGAMIDSGVTPDVFPIVDEVLETFADHPGVIAIFGTSKEDPTLALRRARPSERERVQRAAAALAGTDEGRTVLQRMNVSGMETWIAERAGEIVGLTQFGVFDPEYLDLARDDVIDSFDGRSLALMGTLLVALAGGASGMDAWLAARADEP